MLGFATFREIIYLTHNMFKCLYLHTTNSACTYQPQDLRGRLDAALEQVDTLRDHLQERDTERRELEQKIHEVKRESQETTKALEESRRDSNRYRSSLELISRYFLITRALYFYFILDWCRAFRTAV